MTFRVAVLGTGKMGAGMARSLKREGHVVSVWNRTAERAAPLAEDGIEVAGSVADAVAGADVVITMLFDADSIIDVTDELVGALKGGAVWLQSATVGPDGITRIAEAAGKISADVRLVDAPMLGTVKPAQDGTLVVLASGPADAIDAATPALEAIGSKTINAGDELGAASRLKLACNSWVLSITAATAQSISLCRELGLDPAMFLDAIDGGAVDTPYAHMKGNAMISGEGPVAFQIDGGRKDLDLIREAAAQAGVATDLLDALVALYGRASEAGHGDDDLYAVIHGY